VAAALCFLLLTACSSSNNAPVSTLCNTSTIQQLANPLQDQTGVSPTIGQITIACALGYLNFRYASEDWPSKHRHLAAWYEDLSKRKSIQLTAPRDPS